MAALPQVRAVLERESAWTALSSEADRSGASEQPARQVSSRVLQVEAEALQVSFPCPQAQKADQSVSFLESVSQERSSAEPQQAAWADSSSLHPAVVWALPVQQVSFHGLQIETQVPQVSLPYPQEQKAGLQV